MKLRRSLLRVALLCLMAWPHGAPAAERLGYGRLISNDFLGDGRDRWQTASLSSSRIWGDAWAGKLPKQFGNIRELRIMGAIMAPRNLRHPDPQGRPYATALSFGLHSHFNWHGADTSLGGDLVLTGPMTGLPWLQDSLHDLMGTTSVSRRTRAGAVPDGVHPALVAEMARAYGLGNLQLRPFLAGRWGDETFLRAGADLTLGVIAQGGLLVRDRISGQRYRVVQGRGTGAAFVLGGDVAHVAQTIYLNHPRQTRVRLRTGVHLQTRKAGGFYGLTWLSPEFEGQGRGQIIGSARLRFVF